MKDCRYDRNLFILLTLHALALAAGMHYTQAQNFVLSSAHGVGNGPSAVASVDVNGDGKADLISANSQVPTLTVLTNNWGGTFEFSTELQVGAGAESVIGADVNGDGDLDIICANYLDSSLSILTNYGPGAFKLSSTIGIGSFPGAYPHSVIAVDINQDTHLDLVCADQWIPGQLTVLTNNGDGTFALSGALDVGNYARSVAAADFDGDGSRDLVSANWGDSTLTVLTNNGNGLFARLVTIAVGNEPYSVVAEDVNGDNQPDVISANFADNTLTVLTNNGVGMFTLSSSPIVGSAGGQPTCVIATDVSMDSKPDLVCANSFDGTLSVLTNSGSGAFIISSVLGVGNCPNGVVAADVNEDGKPDLISANFCDNTVTVLLNSPAVPLLAIRLTSSNAVLLSWDAPSAGYLLQENEDLEPANWGNTSYPVTEVGNRKQVTISSPTGCRYFRLFHP